jgi:hypothetical protein
MQQTTELRQQVAEYYEIAPLIVDAIAAQPSAHAIWQELWEQFLDLAIMAIEMGDNPQAHRIYRDMVQSVIDRFGNASEQI